MWSADTGAELRSFLGHGSPITSIAFSPDDTYVLTGSIDLTSRLWNAGTGSEVRRFTGHTQEVWSVAFSRDGRYALTGSEDRTARLWDVASGAEVRRFVGHWAALTSVAQSPDGNLIVTGSQDQTARLWEAATGRELRQFLGHTRNVTSVAFSPDGRYVITGSDDGSARLWDATSGQSIRRFDGHSGPVLSVKFAPDGASVLTAGQDRTVRLWDAARGTETRRFQCSGSVPSAAISSNGQLVLTAEAHGAILRNLSGERLRTFEGHGEKLYPAGWLRDGRLVFESYETVHVWDLITGTERQRFGNDVSSATPSPDGRFLLTGGNDGAARLWDLASGKELRSLKGHPTAITSVAFSPNGRLIATGGGDGTVFLWNADTGRQMNRLQFTRIGSRFDEVAVTSLAFSPDGRAVLLGSEDKAALLWYPSSGVQRVYRHPDSVQSVAFSPDGRFILTGSSDKVARLWEVASSTEIRRFEGHSRVVGSVVFSADGRQALTASYDNTARLWDVATGRELRRFEGHARSVVSAIFSPDGRYVLTGSPDATGRIWDSETGRLLSTLVSFTEGGWAVSDPDGRFDASDPDNSPGLFWLAGDNVIQLGQLKERYYDKGLLAKVVNRLNLKPVPRINEVYLPPELRIDGVGAERVEIVAVNREGGYGDLTVLVNGREVPEIAGRRLDPTQPETRLTVDISQATLLPSGKNVVEVLMKNADNTINSRTSPRGVFLTPERESKAPRLFALLAGVSRYRPGSGLKDLAWSAKDALDMRRAIEAGARQLYPAGVEIEVFASGLDNKEPTKKNILDHLESIARRSRPEDVLFLYFSGHGASARAASGVDLYYYLTADVASADITSHAVASDAISSVELKRYLTQKDMPFKQVMVLDTCAAGSLAAQVTKLSESRVIGGEEARVMELLKDRSGMHILMGSAPDGVSFEASQYAQGLLTHALLFGMKTARVGDGDSIEVLRWFEFAEKKTVELARSMGLRQQPFVSSPKGQSFPVLLATPEVRARIPVSTPRPVLLPPRVSDENDFDDRQLKRALDRKLRELSRPVIRGSESSAPRLVYVPEARDEADDLPEMVTPYIRYRDQDGEVVAVVRLRTLKKVAKSGEVRAPRESIDEITSRIVEWIVANLPGAPQP